MAGHFLPDQIDFYAKRNVCLVAVDENDIVGTISLGDNVIYTTFVEPKYQGRKIGFLLLSSIEELARLAGIKVLKTRSSLNAEMFYAKCGFVKTGEDEDIEFGRTVLMEKVILYKP